MTLLHNLKFSKCYFSYLTFYMFLTIVFRQQKSCCMCRTNEPEQLIINYIYICNVCLFDSMPSFTMEEHTDNEQSLP